MDTHEWWYEWVNEEWAKDVPFYLSLYLDALETVEGRVPSLIEAVEKAKYILGKFNEPGHWRNCERLYGDKEMADTLKRIQEFIKKYSTQE